MILIDFDDFSRRALYTLLKNVQKIQAAHNSELKVVGIIVDQFQARASLPQQMVQELIDESLPLLQPYLRSSVRIRESHEQSLAMIFLDSNHIPTQEFLALHDALARMCLQFVPEALPDLHIERLNI